MQSESTPAYNIALASISLYGLDPRYRLDSLRSVGAMHSNVVILKLPDKGS
jgi:hypothetical protein